MKKIFFILMIGGTFFCSAQKPDKAEVIGAEKNFSAYSVQHGTKEAFLHFLDSTGLVFENGKAINGLEAWNKKANRPGILNWHPVYGEISVSGDLGFTTGPWTFQPKTLQDSVVARGQYSTLWKKNRKGEWKFIIDMGIGKTPPFHDSVYAVSDVDISFVRGTWNNLLNKEQRLIQQTSKGDSKERNKWYASVVSKRAFFINRNGQLPAVNLASLATTLAGMPNEITYTIDGSGISSAGDLGYVYGTTLINGKTDNYLRIWKREGKEWKLALEVLPY